ncbi:glycoside hydrolase family 97 protein [Solitalea sp. MAHUQ-68]|uniref:Glycoside hydrolase family 97 protein n=1 Tax=Solitalea agri TaxID=2953739 RepID=A0A9X2F0H1_9SPHI|nr:glycoside hydrolase family 97 protein [Solitalea agri]MCO4291996.1 glycoside hydrolase family 97 protein [Solitalea agri]
MKRNIVLCLLMLVCTSLVGCKSTAQILSVNSPDGNLNVSFHLKDGVPYYNIGKRNFTVVNDSRMGFILKDIPSLDKDFKIVDSKTDTFDETWTQPWGEVKDIRNNYKRLTVSLQEKKGLKRKMNIVFKVYNDGVGFRYEVPEQPGLTEYQIMDELTEFNMARDFEAWWIPAFPDAQDSEQPFTKTMLSKLNQNVHTPLTMELNDSLFVCIHEAALINYASTTLKPNGTTLLKSDLVPWADGAKVKVKGSLNTPWRTLQIADKPGDLITSYLILNLNEPNRLTDISYIKPGKYTGVWWGMHVKTQTWGQGPQHGATTQNVKDLIDFNKKHNIQGVLAEGWNEGWDGDWVKDGAFNFTKSYPDFDMAELSKYAQENGVALISHHETGGNVANYENQMEDAFTLLEKNNIHAVKTGYVNKRINGKEYHQGQFMVNHYQHVVETAANHKVMVDMHEPIKDTGLRRTYPNLMTREGVRGTEYEAWSEGNTPSHTTIIPFTRGLAGPIDYTPGIFDIQFKNDGGFRVHTTLAKQLALYVVIYSPFQMAADLTKNYENNPAFKFIEDVPTDWETTKVLDAKIGEFVTIVRKDRKSNDWYLGSITNDKACTIDAKLSFLTPGKSYMAEVYADGEGANYDTNPLPVAITQTKVNSESILKISLAAGGGQAIRFRMID